MNKSLPVSILWFRQDLRLEDNPALAATLGTGGSVLPVFIWAPEEEGAWAPGAASRWWLHHSLASLDQALRRLGSRLILRRGPTLETLAALIKETGAEAVCWNRRYEPTAIQRDSKLREGLAGQGVRVESTNAALLHEPWTIRNQARKPFQVFTPFWRHCLAQAEPPLPLPPPERLPSPTRFPASLALAQLELEPTVSWADGFRPHWQPGEPAATRQLDRFLTEAFLAYDEGRNRPDLAGTARLSPHLHFGEVGPRQVWAALKRHAARNGWPDTRWRGSQFLAEIGWREFAHHLLYHFPQTPDAPLRHEFDRFPWHTDKAMLRAWQRGLTGYPIVDAGMRELWATGWMHNRVRMIVASFLVKDLLVDWRAGAKWFWDTLVDADLASNTLGWQWAAGCGADAAPYFRVFNPTSQAEKFDPQRHYIRRWVPELARVPDDWIHQPGEAPPHVLAQAGVRLGKDYPAPIVSHRIAREVALDAYSRMKAKAG